MPDTWPYILKKLRAVGCNCVETYCAWNMHEPKPGEFNFDGILNIKEFIKAAQNEGLMVMVRPGPYICAEWEFGGLIDISHRFRNYNFYLKNSPHHLTNVALCGTIYTAKFVFY